MAYHEQSTAELIDAANELTADMREWTPAYRATVSNYDLWTINHELVNRGYPKAYETWVNTGTWVAEHQEDTMKPPQVSDQQIEALEQEAGRAGDLEMVQICRAALRGVTAARDECARVIADAAAQID